MKYDEKTIRKVVEDVLSRLKVSDPGLARSGNRIEPSGPSSPIRPVPSGRLNHGVFGSADDACGAAQEAFLKLKQAGVAGREKVVQIVKSLCHSNAKAWGQIEFDETRIGRLEHKIEKLLGIRNVPGTEFISPYGMSGDHGITMEENTPFGVVGAITPVTHSIPTIACNIVNIVAAGNAVVFNAHPGGKKCAAMAIRVFNEAIHRETGIDNLATIIEEPSLESFDDICKNENISLLCVTGGPGIVKAAMQSGKRAICAGPGNPPVVVDESADLEKAARDIIFGASWDNNLLCIGEKEVFVLDKVYDRFLEAFIRAGATKIDQRQLARLTEAVFTFEGEGGGCSTPVLKRDLIGKDASFLAREAGTKVPGETLILFAETEYNHPFVVEEQMMPMLPVVRVRNIDEAVQRSKEAEHGYKHSSMIHTKNVDSMTLMARELDCTLFIKNGSCLTGLGSGGEGYPSFSIATTTGEGITTPLTFTRKRRCVLVDALKIY